jgi:hypothetical protein
MIALLPNFLSFQAGEQDRDGESVMLLLTVRQTLAELYVETDQHREAETYCRSALVTAQTHTATCLERHERITVGKGICPESWCTMGLMF